MNSKCYRRKLPDLGDIKLPGTVKKRTTQNARLTKFMMDRPVWTFETDEHNKGRPTIHTDQYITVNFWEISHLLQAYFSP